MTFTRFEARVSLESPTVAVSACTPAESPAADRLLPPPRSPSRSEDQARPPSSRGPSSGSNAEAASAGRAICGFPAESEETRPADPPVRGSAAYQEWLAAALAWARGSRHIVGEVTLGLGRAQGVRQGDLFHVIGRGSVKATVLVHEPPSESECRAVPLTLVPFQPVLPGDLALRIGE